MSAMLPEGVTLDRWPDALPDWDVYRGGQHVGSLTRWGRDCWTAYLLGEADRSIRATTRRAALAWLLDEAQRDAG